MWWMGEPWIVKKYIDEVFLAGVGVLFANDGRSRADESLKYGSGGLARDKRVMLSVTWNAPKEAFIESRGFFEVWVWRVCICIYAKHTNFVVWSGCRFLCVMMW